MKRFEVFPSSVLKAEILKCAGIFPRDVRALHVTCSPRASGGAIFETLKHATELSEMLPGVRIVPHISASQVRDEAHLDQICSMIASQNFREAFVVSGDASPLGCYNDSVELLPQLRRRLSDDTEFGMAAYPAERGFQRTLLKQRAGASYLISQLCFDKEALVSWALEARRSGVTLPLYASAVGPVSYRRLADICGRLGLSASLALADPRLLWGPRSAARAALSRHPGLFEGIHVCTFNNVAASLQQFT